VIPLPCFLGVKEIRIASLAVSSAIGFIQTPHPPPFHSAIVKSNPHSQTTPDLLMEVWNDIEMDAQFGCITSCLQIVFKSSNP
jgi:hypothetical protein